MNTASEIYVALSAQRYRARQRAAAAVLNADIRDGVGRFDRRLGGSLGEIVLVVGHRGRRSAPVGMARFQHRFGERCVRRSVHCETASTQRDAVAAVRFGAVLLGGHFAVSRIRHNRIENRSNGLTGLRRRARRTCRERIVVLVLELRLCVEGHVALVDGIVLDLPDGVDDVVKPRGQTDLGEEPRGERVLRGGRGGGRRRGRMGGLDVREEKAKRT